jgi:hypothetical protein
MMKSVRTTLSPLILSCLLLLACNRASSGEIVGSWYYKDFPGLTCVFKTDGTYNATMVTKEGVKISADGTYSVEGLRGEPQTSAPIRAISYLSF